MIISHIICDIEGTTTDISFVHDTLFPYAARSLPTFIANHLENPTAREYLNMCRETIATEQSKAHPSPEELSQILQDWISQDRKHPGLKGLQGLIWQDGYENSSYKGHIYDDVVPCLQKWQTRGISLNIYSSGSEFAQKLLFGYSTKGDLTAFFDHYFDTTIGPKRDPKSYSQIALKLNTKPQNALFLSDVGAELDAAKSVGMQTAQLVRPGTSPVDNHFNAKDFFAVTNLITDSENA